MEINIYFPSTVVTFMAINGGVSQSDAESRPFGVDNADRFAVRP